MNLMNVTGRIKISILLVLLIVFSGVVRAEVPAEKDSGVRGKVVDRQTNRVVEYATIMVYRSADSSFVEGGITDASGSFQMKLKPDEYYLTVQFLGYQTVVVEAFEVDR
ncbi:MAG TPA: carboxypeptidase-like regulatory domain-containing protein, partial [Bacteroidales bacterium]|nr:carboxypeptidase-like regulatory domain-containing protein [Bacteroidales bacterium]